MTAVRITREAQAFHNTTNGTTRAYNMRGLRMMVMLIILGLLVFALAGFTHNFIPSESMEPNLRPGDHIVTMRDWLAYPGGAMPARGDVVVFRLPQTVPNVQNSVPAGPDSGVVDAAEREDRPSKAKAADALEILIKRVVGLPGDMIQIKDNDVYINGKLYKEDYDLIPVDGSTGYAFPYAVYEPLRVPPGHLFVLGDNRNNSDDGRFWGTLDRSNVIGRFVRVLYHESKYDLSEAALFAKRHR